jgi:hypothetical protein
VDRFLEAADRLAEAAAEARKPTGAEDQNHDRQDDEQLRYAEVEHD